MRPHPLVLEVSFQWVRGRSECSWLPRNHVYISRTDHTVGDYPTRWPDGLVDTINISLFPRFQNRISSVRLERFKRLRAARAGSLILSHRLEARPRGLAPPPAATESKRFFTADRVNLVSFRASQPLRSRRPTCPLIGPSRLSLIAHPPLGFAAGRKRRACPDLESVLIKPARGEAG